MKPMSLKCPKCRKIIAATSETQLKWNLHIHQISKECKGGKNDRRI